MKNKILISGGLGILGSAFVDKLKKNNSIVVIDNLSKSSIQTAADFEKQGITVLLQDIRRRKKTCKDFNIVFHLASQTNISNSASDPLSDASNNILGTIALLKNYPSSKFVYFSSEMVYGKVRNASEESRPDPETPYGFSKLGGEVYVRMFCENYLILRIAEKINNVNNLVDIVNSLIERDITGTINVGDSPSINCSKLKSLMLYGK